MTKGSLTMNAFCFLFFHLPIISSHYLFKANNYIIIIIIIVINIVIIIIIIVMLINITVTVVLEKSSSKQGIQAAWSTPIHHVK